MMRLSIYLSLVVLLGSFGMTLSAQELPGCGTQATPDQIAYMTSLNKERNAFGRSFEKDDLDSIPIQIHIIRTSQGTGGVDLAILQEAIDITNDYYEGANMFFFQCNDINYIDNSTYYDYDTFQEDELGSMYDVENVINIYFANSLSSNGGGLCGYTYFPPSADRVFMANGCTEGGSTLTHELGHYFTLYHTHGKFNCGQLTDELVDGSNCDVAGDDVCDTPADPNLLGVNCDGYVVDESCNYFGTETDANGDLFVPDVTNIMAYSRRECRATLTPGQLQRVAFGYATGRSYLQQSPCVGGGCEGLTTITQCEGLLQDGSGISNYENDLACEWLIQPINAEQVSFTFNNFDVDAAGDTLYMYDGADANAPLLGMFTGTELPGNITTTQGSLFLRFVTDGDVTSAGWDGRYSCVLPLDGYCNGQTILSGCSGTFSDYSGTSNYLENSECEWLIQADSGDYIELNFTMFQTEGFYDFVSVFDGNSAQAPLIGSYSGNEAPPTVYSSGSNLFVTFESDGSVQQAGFEATYQCVTGPIPALCQSYTELEDCYITIEDGSGERNYGGNSDCYWYATNDFADYFRIDVEFVETLPGDTLYIYDGTGATAPVLGKFSGDVGGVTLFSSQAEFVARFVTDESDQADGWIINAACQYGTPPSCGGITALTGCTGEFEDGSGSDDYGNDTFCQWSITTPAGTYAQIAFTEFDTESFYDDVLVYDGPGTNSPLLGVYSGNQLPDLIHGSSNQLFVVFDTDFTGTGAGWTAQYNCVDTPPPPTCEGSQTIAQCNTTVDDGSEGRPYSNNLDCEYIFKPTGGATYLELYVNGRIPDENDSLIIYDGLSTDDPIIGIFNSSYFNEYVYSTQPEVLVRFVTDGEETGDGWSITGYCEYGTPPSCSGITEISACEGTITDGSGTEDYGNNSNCGWHINAPGATYISLDFTEFDLEQYSDVIRVYEGSDATGTMIAYLEGRDTPQNIYVLGEDMFVQFTTNSFGTAPGWSADFACGTGEPPATCTETIEYDGCQNNYVEDGSGTRDYSNNLNCGYLITGDPTAYYLRINVNYLDIEFGADSLIIYDGPDETAPVLAALTGSNSFIDPILSSTNEVFMRFTSDEDVVGGGWYLYYYCVYSPPPSCSGLTELPECSGTFDDGSGSDEYGSNSDCDWLISAPGANYIQLDFTSFETESYDRVRVYDGDDQFAPLIATFSGFNIPPTVYSSGENLFVNFDTDGSVTYDGFEATYNCFYTGEPPTCGGTEVYTFCSDWVEDGSAFNEDYANDMACEYLIDAPGDYLEIDFYEFDIEANDSLVFYDGPTTASPVLGVYSGNTLPDDLYSSTSNILVVFYTDESGTADGWEFRYNCQYGSPQCTTVTELTGCTGTFEDGSGNSNYANGLDCEWYINTGTGTPITLTFNSFELEGCCDYVRVYDGNSTAAPLLGSYNGRFIPEPVISTSDEMFIEFTSDGSVTYDGWSATYDCSIGIGDYDNVSYTNIYPNPTNGTTYINLSLKQSDKLMLEVFDLKGKQVYSRDLGDVGTEYRGTLDLTGLSSGLYTLSVSGERSVHHERLIIK